ncbi:uncharacterized protein LOC143450299 [Clavelina lepadiformis]|uniref:uncharacterized protein LOC143450299 n=1 Tax=Clavelina lepadiformis TaxID=159417 RepID=UPI0040439292
MMEKSRGCHVGKVNQLHSKQLKQNNVDLECSSFVDTQSFTASLSTKQKSVITLKDWYIQPCHGKPSIKVCGTSILDDHVRCSGAISTRVNSHSVITKNGTKYKLVGPIQSSKYVPKWLKKQFQRGFPSSWKVHVEKYMDWLEEHESDNETDVDTFLGITSGEPQNLFNWAICVIHKCLYIEGFLKQTDGTYQLYRTSPVSEIINSNTVKTASGKEYCLIGRINQDASINSKLPLWMVKNFEFGFSSNWKEILHSYNTQRHNQQESFDCLNAVDRIVGISAVSHETKPASKSCYKIPSLTWLGSDAEDSINLNTSLLSTNVEVPDTVLRKPPLSKLAQMCVENLNSIDVAKSFLNSEFDVVEECLQTIKPSEKISARVQKHSHPPSQELSAAKSQITPQNDKTKNAKKRRSSSKKKKKHDSVVANTNLFTPSPQNGFYRSKSGRHVFPPLQHWTRQRLVTECDEDGTEVVVLYPGHRSVLDASSSSYATDVIKQSESIQKQYLQDQLEHSFHSVAEATPPGKNVQPKGTKKQTPGTCVKNILDDDPLNLDIQNLEKEGKLPIAKSCQVVVNRLKFDTKSINSLTPKPKTPEVNGGSADLHTTEKSVPQNDITKHKRYNLRQTERSHSSKKEMTCFLPKEISNKKRKKTSSPSKESCPPSFKKRRKSKSDKNKATSKTSKAKRNCVRNKTTAPLTKENKENTSFVFNTCPQNKNVRKKLTEVNAKHGTIKHRKQIKEALKELNSNVSQDFFTAACDSKRKELSAFSNDYFQSNTDWNDPALFTPTAKLPVGMNQFAATPAWLKTPTCAFNVNFEESVTPYYLRTTLPSEIEIKTSSNDADKVVLQMVRDAKQKSKLKKGKKKILEDKTIDRSCSRLQLPTSKASLLNAVVENEISDEDDYFSE